MPETRTREMSVRKILKRQGRDWRLRSSRRRDPNAVDFGQWRIETPRGRTLVTGTLEELRAWLRTPPDER